MNEQTWHLTFWNGVRLIAKDVTVTNKAYLANAVLTPINVDCKSKHYMPDHICLEDISEGYILVFNYDKTEVIATLARSASEAYDQGYDNGVRDERAKHTLAY